MKRLKPRLLQKAFVWTASLLLSSSSFAASEFAAKISQTNGDVQIKLSESSSWIKAKRGDVLTTGAQIKTQTGSRAYLETRTNDRVQLFQKTTVELKESSKEKTRIKVLIGRMRSLVRYIKQRTSYEVHTPIAVASVRGTEFDTIVDEDGKSTFEVYKGVVGVKDLDGIGEEVSLFKNQRTTIERGAPPTPPENFTREMRGMLRERREINRERQLAQLEARREMAIESVKEHLQTNLVNEQRMAQYQDGKVAINAIGERVQIEEYITRPDPRQFSFVTLNITGGRFSHSRYDAFARDPLPARLNLDNLFSREGNDTTSNFVEKHKRFVSDGSNIYREWAENGQMVYFSGSNRSEVVYGHWYAELKGASDSNFTLVSHWKPQASYLAGGNPTITENAALGDGAPDIPTGYEYFQNGGTLGDDRAIDNVSFSDRLLNSTIFGNSNYQSSEGYSRKSRIQLDGVEYANLTTVSAKLAALLNTKVTTTLHEYTRPNGSKIDLQVDNYYLDDTGKRLSLLDIQRLPAGSGTDSVNFETVATSSLFTKPVRVMLTPRIFKKAGLLQ